MENQIEVWKDVVGYEGLYQVSNYSNVKSLIRGKLLKSIYPYKDYNFVKLYKNGKRETKGCHVLCGEAFLGYDTKNKFGLVLDHKNDNKKDNFLSNLQIITQRQNVRKSIVKKNTPYYGVYKVGNKWRARFYFKNKPYHVGYYNCDYEAHIAVEQKIKELENGRNS